MMLKGSWHLFKSTSFYLDQIKEENLFNAFKLSSIMNIELR